MIVFKFKSEDNFIEINNCENGVDVSIEQLEYDEMTWQNIVIPKDQIPELIKLLQDGIA